MRRMCQLEEGNLVDVKTVDNWARGFDSEECWQMPSRFGVLFLNVGSETVRMRAGVFGTDAGRFESVAIDP